MYFSFLLGNLCKNAKHKAIHENYSIKRLKERGRGKGKERKGVQKNVMEHCGTEQLQTKKRHALAGRAVVCVRERLCIATMGRAGSSQQQYIPHCGLGKHKLRHAGKGEMLEWLRYITSQFSIAFSA